MVEGSSSVGQRKIHDLRSRSVCPLLSVSSDIFVSLWETRMYFCHRCVFCLTLYTISSISFSVTSLNVQRMSSFPTCFSPWLKIIDWRRHFLEISNVAHSIGEFIAELRSQIVISVQIWVKFTWNNNLKISNFK